MPGPIAAAYAFSVFLAAQQLGLGFDGRAQVVPLPSVVPGAAGELSVTILDRPSELGLLSVRLTSDSVTLPENRLGVPDIVDPQASQPRFRGRFIAPVVPGLHTVEGVVEYVTCHADWCRPRRARVVWEIRVVESTGPKPVADPLERPVPQ